MFESHEGSSSAISHLGDDEMPTDPDPSARSLEEIVRRLNPNVPAGTRADGMPRIPRDSNAVRQITTLLRADPFGKALLTGHIGVGKSTELAHLTNELASQRFTIRCSVADSVGSQNADTFTLLVVVLEAAIRAWIAKLGPMPPGLVEQVVDRVEKLGLRSGPGAAGSQDQPAQRYRGPYRVLREIMREAYGGVTTRIRTGEQLAALYSDCIRRLAIRYVAGADLSRSTSALSLRVAR